VLIGGQKSGMVWAHDPDKKGAVVWKNLLASTPPPASGQIVWGGAADELNACRAWSFRGDGTACCARSLRPRDACFGISTRRNPSKP
jgi:hypothetical protein